jgi:hypothetical protein
MTISRSPQTIVIEVLLNIYKRKDYLKYFIELCSEGNMLLRMALIKPDTEAARKVGRGLEVLFENIKNTFIKKAVEKRMRLTRLCALRPVPGHHINSIDSAKYIDSQTRLRLPTGTMHLIIERDSRVHLYLPGLGVVDERRTEPGGLAFPEIATYLLERIMAMVDEFTIEDLPKVYSRSARITVVQRLTEEGALIVIK